MPEREVEEDVVVGQVPDMKVKGVTGVVGELLYVELGPAEPPNR